MNKLFKVADVKQVEEKEGLALTWKSSTLSTLYALALVAITLLALYALFRGATLFNPGYRWIDRIIAIPLLGAEGFILIHGVGYLLSTIKATKGYKVTRTRVFAPLDEPSVALVIASFNEEPSILEDTIVSVTNLEYANKRVYLLDDSTKENLQKETETLAERYKCTYVHRANRRGYKAGAINDLLKILEEKYMAVFDADQKPVSTFLREIIPLLEADEKLAFVQTPQFYEKTKYSRVAHGASQQQAVFYEYICEGKGVSDAMFFCGTNVVLRTEALRSIGGLDESSVTEDFATSVHLHTKGWKSLYYNKVFVYGLGPETLSGYFTQQTRWATGTLGVFKKIVRHFLQHPRALRRGQWWEYFLSGSYYFIGWVNFIFILAPVAFVIFGLRPLIADPLLYIAAFVPYFLFSMSTFYLSMGRRSYRVRDLFLGQSLGLISFWIQIKASVAAMLGKKRAFGVTPKGASGRIPLRYLTPQLSMMVLSLLTMSVGIYKVTATMEFAMLISLFWAAYHSVLLGVIFYFNHSFREHAEAHIFKDWAAP